MKLRNPDVSIQVPEPCSQLWDEMTPEAGGRHCVACAKTVTDFTRMSDVQILEALRNSAGGCGRFRTDQLNRQLIALPAEKRVCFSGFYKLAASLLLVFSAGKAKAQQPIEIHTQDKKQQQQDRTVTVISGFVRDEMGESINHAIIKIEDVHSRVIAGIQTGLDGEFKLSLSDSLFNEGALKGIVSLVGYSDSYFTLTQESSVQLLDIVLKIPKAGSTMISGEYIEITVGDFAKKPSKKWWQFWKRRKK